jgi:hypothetical protein
MMSVTPSPVQRTLCTPTKPVHQTSSVLRSMYEVTLYKRGLVHVLADDVEDAAWQAVHIACNDDDILIDVCPLEETP